MKDLNKMNLINRKGHIESCVTCREKDKVKGIAKFFKKETPQETAKIQIVEQYFVGFEEQTSATSATSVKLPIFGAEGENSAEFLEPKTVEAVEHTTAQISKPAINVDESQSEQKLDTLTLKCEGYHLMVYNPADIYKLFPFTLIANENFVFENGTLHHKQCCDRNYVLYNKTDESPFSNKECFDLKFSEKVRNIIKKT